VSILPPNPYTLPAVPMPPRVPPLSVTGLIDWFVAINSVPAFIVGRPGRGDDAAEFESCRLRP